MKNILATCSVIVGIAVALVVVWYSTAYLPIVEQQEGFSISREVLGGDSSDLFSRVTAPRTFQFPEDHGPHPQYRSEWWYFSGNLSTSGGEQFGYQFTVFRQAIGGGKPETNSGWETNDIYMAHVGLTDAQAGKNYSNERFSRGAAGLAGAKSDLFDIWVNDWSAKGTSLSNCFGCLAINIQADTNEYSIQLQLSSAKPIVYHGDRGFSQKGDAAGNASYYYSLTRLETNGVLRVGESEYSVTGLSWMDHEWSTSALGETLRGWDWFALQLDDGKEIMYYQLRTTEGHAHHTSEGTVIDEQGETSRIFMQDVTLNPTREWTSSKTGVVYPVGWTIELPRYDTVLKIDPLIDNQERAETFRYWEGAVRVRGTQQGVPVTGVGYVELVGYEREVE